MRSIASQQDSALPQNLSDAVLQAKSRGPHDAANGDGGVLRSALLELLRRSAAPVIVIDLSAVSYLDMSGMATLLETLKAARERSVKLRLTGMSGQSRTLAEIAQLDAIFRAWGSEVEFR